MVLHLAEASLVYQPLDADEELVSADDHVVFFGASGHVSANAVQHLRFAADKVTEAVERVRDLARARNRYALTWEVSDEAEPRDLLARLQAMGMRPSDPPTAVVMALSHAPRSGPPDVEVTRVTTLAEFEAHLRVSHEVFNKMDRLPAALAEIEREGPRKLADKTFVRYTAWREGRPVGAATATFTPVGTILHSGSTLADARGRGVYTAMVAQRWQDAIARGPAQVVTRAGPMSQPILLKLGFRELTRIHFLVDEIAVP